MKRYELAKQKGLNWQVVLIQDTETDIKTITLEGVKRGDNFGTINKKVTEAIKECVNTLDSEELKQSVKQSLPNFASRIYLQWLKIYGNNQQGYEMLLLLKSKEMLIPQNVIEELKALPFTDTFTRATPNMTYKLEYEKQVISRVNTVLSMQAKQDYTQRYSLRASCERQVRYEWQRDNLKKMYDDGYDLVWINTHANCSERCAKWQGKLYSISGKSGTIDGIKYQPLSNATDIEEQTLSGKTYINGCLTGFNCRHTTTPYTKGSRPTHVPAKVVEKQREIEQRQRELERRVRQYETRVLGWRKNKATAKNKKEKSIAIAQYNHNYALMQKWEKEYREFSKKNNVPIYPSRLTI